MSLQQKLEQSIKEIDEFKEKYHSHLEVNDIKTLNKEKEKLELKLAYEIDTVS